MGLIDDTVIIVTCCSKCVGVKAGGFCKIQPGSILDLSGVKVMAERHPNCPLNKSAYKFVKPGVMRHG